MGSDSGRNFLSTEDPVKCKLLREDQADLDDASKAESSASLTDFLRLFFVGLKDKR
jgi:hypothetical protein